MFNFVCMVHIWHHRGYLFCRPKVVTRLHVCVCVCVLGACGPVLSSFALMTSQNSATTCLLIMILTLLFIILHTCTSADDSCGEKMYHSVYYASGFFLLVVIYQYNKYSKLGRQLYQEHEHVISREDALAEAGEKADIRNLDAQI